MNEIEKDLPPSLQGKTELEISEILLSYSLSRYIAALQEEFKRVDDDEQL